MIQPHLCSSIILSLKLVFNFCSKQVKHGHLSHLSHILKRNVCLRSIQKKGILEQFHHHFNHTTWNPDIFSRMELDDNKIRNTLYIYIYINHIIFYKKRKKKVNNIVLCTSSITYGDYWMLTSNIEYFELSCVT